MPTSFRSDTISMLDKAAFVIVIGFMTVVIAQSTLPSPNGFCAGDICYIKPNPDAKKTWAEAQQICKNYNATLPIADNPKHQRIFEAALSNYNLTTKEVWLGATAVEYNSTDWRWVDGTQYSATDFPQTTGYYYSYATLTNSTVGVHVLQSPANNSWFYICQYSLDAGNCTNGTRLNIFFMGDRCYVKYVHEKLSWFSARNKCLENNGDLASFAELSLLFANINSNAAWVGLRHSQWNWQNAVTGLTSEVTYTSWSSDQPNDATPSCISTRSADHQSWKDWNCSRGCYYICQVITTTQDASPIPKSSSIKTTSSTLSLPGSAATNTKQEVNLPLAVGLGVGLGAAAILIIVVIIIVLAVQRKHKNGGSNGNSKSGKTVVDQNGQNNSIEETTEMNGTVNNSQSKLNDPATVYATALKVRGFENDAHPATGSSSQPRLDDALTNYATVQEAIGREHNSQLAPSSLNQGPVYADLGFSPGSS